MPSRSSYHKSVRFASGRHPFRSFSAKARFAYTCCVCRSSGSSLGVFSPRHVYDNSRGESGDLYVPVFLCPRFFVFSERNSASSRLLMIGGVAAIVLLVALAVLTVTVLRDPEESAGAFIVPSGSPAVCGKQVVSNAAFSLGRTRVLPTERDRALEHDWIN